MPEQHQKWTALLVTIAFAWLLQASATTLAAAGPREQAGPASLEQETGFIEQQGAEWDRGRKKNAPLIIILGFVAISLLWLIIHGIDLDAAPGPANGLPGANRERIIK